jgi:predicted dehydrogenase
MTTRRDKTAVGIVGFGKIARSAHTAALTDSPAFFLHSIADTAAPVAPVPCYPDVEHMLAAHDPPDVVAVCTPPQARYRVAWHALSRGRDVLLEKPPCATVGEVEALEALAKRVGRTLFCAWHSRFAPAVAPAQHWLSSRTVRKVRIDWREDVREWHPGQTWIWEPGGFGVFDPGINALSIVTAVLPQPFILCDAQLRFPENCDTPVSANLTFSDANEADMSAAFDWLHPGAPAREIAIDTDDGQLRVLEGGSRLAVDAREIELRVTDEYRALYLHFGRLLDHALCDVDLRPLRLVADAFMRGRKEAAPAFID